MPDAIYVGSSPLSSPSYTIRLPHSGFRDFQKGVSTPIHPEDLKALVGHPEFLLPGTSPDTGEQFHEAMAQADSQREESQHHAQEFVAEEQALAAIAAQAGVSAQEAAQLVAEGHAEEVAPVIEGSEARGKKR